MVEGARLEIVWAGNSLGGSNPLASATAPEAVFFGFGPSVRILSFVMAPEAVFLLVILMKFFNDGYFI